MLSSFPERIELPNYGVGDRQKIFGARALYLFPYVEEVFSLAELTKHGVTIDG